MTLYKKDITAVILAGGKGQRLGGQDKGLLHYQGKPLVEHVLERITPQVNHILINANRNQKRYSSYGYTVFSDDLQDYQGPLAGFSAAMKAATTDYIITLPCDGPLLPVDLVSRMLAQLNNPTLPLAKMAIAHDGKRPQRIYALIATDLMGNLDSFLSKGDRKVGLWFSQQHVAYVDFSDNAEAFLNINTAEQLP